MYACRTVPPSMPHEGLASYGIALRSALEQLVGDALPERSWSLAQLGVAQGGLGIRDPARHASAAYWASLVQTRDLCRLLDPEYEADDRSGGSGLAAMERELRGEVLNVASWD